MMTTEAQAPRLRELPQVLSAIISAARRRAGVAALSDAALADEIRDWQRILAPIPADRLEECELRAIRTAKRQGAACNRRNFSQPGARCAKRSAQGNRQH